MAIKVDYFNPDHNPELIINVFKVRTIELLFWLPQTKIITYTLSQD